MAITKFFTPPCGSNIWCKSTICRTRNTKHAVGQRGTNIHSSCHWNAIVLQPIALNAIATQQATPTQKTMERVKQFLDYCASQEEAIFTYNACGMMLAIHSNAGYLNESKAHSWVRGRFFLSSDIQNPPNNGAVMTIAQIINTVMSSMAEA